MSDPRRAFIWRASLPDITPLAFKLAWLLCYKYGSKEGLIFPDQETLAKDLGVTDRQVRRLIPELVLIGLKVKIKRGPRTGTTQSFYSFSDRIPDTHVRNSSGHTGPELEPEFRTSVSRDPDIHVQSSGHPCPPNLKTIQKKDPIPPSADAPVRVEAQANDIRIFDDAVFKFEDLIAQAILRDEITKAEASRYKRNIQQLLGGISGGKLDWRQAGVRLEGIVNAFVKAVEAKTSEQVH